MCVHTRIFMNTPFWLAGTHKYIYIYTHTYMHTYIDVHIVPFCVTEAGSEPFNLQQRFMSMRGLTCRDLGTVSPCMCVKVCVCMHVYMYTCTYKHTYSYIYAYTHACMYGFECSYRRLKCKRHTFIPRCTDDFGNGCTCTHT
jgi:hypothetical protein